ncbi:MAG: xanthine dehydrogenase accessory protein XdhC [Sphingomonas sp.]|uniref:xanthine dehydrogenase accessory protein XdhC n=1 Tax=Sphingomonas sp. TaxID=28214 RepID=UPI0025D87CEB|nr:xanthine dehydrogenase accessory protein XdhC [Sphingomonas sp.]MBX3566043.1 xanthine dehydrogenase accessory protein XdhC [Sphingomonas sp.]
MSWAGFARAALAAEPVALVTVLATEGSAPRGPGARMVVTAGCQHGTIGGGALEHQAAAQARAILGLPPGSWRVQDYPLGPLLGQCCGGRVRLLVERLAEVIEEPAIITLGGTIQRIRLPGEGRDPASEVSQLDPGVRRGAISARGPLPVSGNSFAEPTETDAMPLFLFGAGHVGQAIAARAQGLPLHLAWFDTRPEAAETPGVVLANEDEMVACAGEAPADAAVVILTHDHGLDYRLTEAALGSPAHFVGLIGSQTKRARFVSRLDKAGIDAGRLTCPIGLAGIDGKEPEVIAIATLAQLLTLRQAA